MMSTLISIILILILFLGIPVLLLWIRDRSKLAGGFVTRTFGFIVLLCGVALLAFLIFDIVRSEKGIGEIGIKYLLWSIWPVGFIIFGLKWLKDSGPGIEDHKVDFNSPELKASIDKARGTLPLFIENVKKHMNGAFLKFQYKTDEDVIEHVWAYVHHYADGQFNVSMVNQPYTQKCEFENRFNVAEKDVEDWQLVYPDGRIKGAYSRIGALEYLERKGIRFNKTLRNQKRQLIDAESQFVRDR